MDVAGYNRKAWNRQAKSGACRWSEPVSPEEIARARRRDWQVILTPNKPVPRNWFGEVEGKDLLCLASGGGQQAPVLAAAGARVTSFDGSDEQLALDGAVAEREGLEIRLERGDMADLSRFGDGSFDLIFHPVSNVFVQDVRPVWRECFRVLRSGGRLLAGFMNPSYFYFDHEEAETSGQLVAKYRLPFSDLTSLPEKRLQAIQAEGVPLEFGHSLEEQIGGQIEAGFLLRGLYEDDWDDESTPLNRLGCMFIATLGEKG